MKEQLASKFWEIFKHGMELTPNGIILKIESNPYIMWVAFLQAISISYSDSRKSKNQTPRT